ncbi:MAG: zinc-dependent metalloprotease, partial [Pirellulaceae bacterium]
MSANLRVLGGLCCLVLLATATQRVRGDDGQKEDEKTKPEAVGEVSPAAAGSGSSSSSSSSGGSSAAAHAALLREATQHSGMMNLWQKGNNLYAELSSGDYNSEFIVLISISRGISVGDLIGGYSWNMGDDWLWTFRKVDDRVHIIRTNVRFKANPGFPEALSVRNAYTDSVLFSLPIITKGPKGGDLINLSQVFMSDLPQISQRMPGFVFSPDRSTWASVKSFDRNVELEVAATYASSGRMNLDTVPDSRGATINVHYSISKLTSSGYQPRLADDRVGYFLTVVKDFNKQSDRDQFVRYVNRWHLESPPGVSQAPYPPKKAIIFYIEKTVPHKYRAAVRAGIEEWNKAFEKAGWINAIEVRQQGDSDTWDPEDINYNTFRWITANAGFAMGPSRVNPRTGQILDADIIFDADFLTFWKQEFETLNPQTAVRLHGLAPVTPGKEVGMGAGAELLRSTMHPECRMAYGMSSQLAFGSAALAAMSADPKLMAAEQEKLILQGLKEVVMHEVGHTLGLRHNFKASKLYSLKDLNDPEKAKDGAIVSSVMDYSPSNIVPKDWKQGNYYSSTIGPYDYWAIEYGYKPLSGGTNGEVAELEKIAARSGDPALAYATDEDTRSSDPDPDVNVWDLGSDAIEYAKQRAQIVQEVMPTLMKRVTKEGEDYTQVRRAFGVLLSEYGNAMYYVARTVGGLSTSRSHKGDKDAKPPITLVDASKQREALAMLEEHVFSSKPYEFPEELYSYLASSRWSHWGVRGDTRKDYPIHDAILQWQTQVLDHLLAPVTLERIHDTEVKVSANTDVLTTAELIERLTRAMFSELDNVKEGEFTNRKPAINSQRRNLQREYLRRQAELAMGDNGGLTLSFLGISFGGKAPDDCQTIAFAELSALEARMSQ